MDLEALIEEKVANAALRVPPSPIVALRLGKLAADEGATRDEVVAVVKQDQSLAAVVLRLANSAMYRRGPEVVSLSTAVVTLGRRVLRDLAFAQSLHQQALGIGPLIALRRRAWRESLVAGQVAQWIAELGRAPLEDAFVAGLLHDIGRLPVIGALEALLAAHPEADTRSEEGWWKLVEAHHVTLGAQLAHAWSLPAVLTDVITRHHDSHQTGPLHGVVRLADEVIQLLDGEAGLPTQRLVDLGVLDVDQCARLAERLPFLPSYLDAFREPTGDEADLHAIDYEVRLQPELKPTTQLTLHVEGLIHDADVLAIDDRHVVVHANLRPGRLVRFRFNDFTVPARVTACAEDEAVLAPWALDEAQRTAWKHFVEQVSQSVAA